MHKPYFSIIIPTLNEEYYVPRLLNTLSLQVYKNFEVLVVDGLSRDNTKQVAKEAGKRLPDFRLIAAGRNNVSYQRNLGAREAQGWYLIFFDADVLVPQEFLQKLEVVLDRDKLLLATTLCEADGEELWYRILVYLGNVFTLLGRRLGKPNAGGFDVIIENNTFFQLGGFREDLFMSEDHDLVERAAVMNVPIVILKAPKITMSFRRFRSEGSLWVVFKWVYAFFYGLLFGPITRPLFDYQMGGSVQSEDREKT